VLRGLTSCEVQCSTSSQPDKNLCVCVSDHCGDAVLFTISVQCHQVLCIIRQVTAGWLPLPACRPMTR